MATALGRRELFIGGRWVEPAAGGTLDVINPATEQVVGHLGAATQPDIHAAVTAARSAFPGWRATSGITRGAVLRRIAASVRDRKSELAVLETTDCGKPLDEAEWDMDDVATCFEVRVSLRRCAGGVVFLWALTKLAFRLQYYAEKAEALDAGAGVTKVVLPDDRFSCAVHREPLGVVALITPWNYPLLYALLLLHTCVPLVALTALFFTGDRMATWKVAPALAAGCACILKPSENASLTCLALADIAHGAGVPPGVLNILSGLGPDAGAPLVAHPGVDKVAFTGSLATGKAVMRSAAERVCPVSLELGGKSPVVVFEDAIAGGADAVAKVVEWIMFGIFWTNGQICSATSRLLVQRSAMPAVLAALKHHAEAVCVCDPMSRQCRMGPVVNSIQYSKIKAMIATAVHQGATVLTGGARPAHLDAGYYLAPTVFTDVKPDMSIWTDEIFGPVLCVMPFDSEEEAIQLANSTQYGLGAAVLTSDSATAQRMTAAFDCGLVWVNCSQPCFCHGPWGGRKLSGFGRELGEHGMSNYQNIKQVVEWKDPGVQFGWYPSFSTTTAAT